MEFCVYRGDLCDSCSNDAIEKDMFRERSELYRNKHNRLKEEHARVQKKNARLSEQLKAEQKKTARLEEHLSEARKLIETLKAHAQKASCVEAAIQTIEEKVVEKDSENENLRQLNMRFAIDIKVLQEMVRTYAEQLNHRNCALMIADRTEARYHALYEKLREEPAFKKLLEQFPMPRSNASQYFFGAEDNE